MNYSAISYSRERKKEMLNKARSHLLVDLNKIKFHLPFLGSIMIYLIKDVA